MSYQNVPIYAVAVPANDSGKKDYGLEHENVYSDAYGNNGHNNSSVDDTIDRSASLFSQLDSMIASVQVESNAVEQMKSKLKEMENLKEQVTSLTEKLLNADQQILSLKSNTIDNHEQISKLKRTKLELEGVVGPMRGELEKNKDAYKKERVARLNTQQELQTANEKIQKMQHRMDEMERDLKTIPSLQESNELLKNDLAQLRQRYKDDRHSMQKTIRHLESNAQDLETNRSEIRNIVLRLLDTTGTTGNAPAQAGMLPIAGHQESQQQSQYPQNFAQPSMQLQTIQSLHASHPPPGLPHQQHQQHQMQQHQQMQQMQQMNMSQQTNVNVSPYHQNQPHAMQKSMQTQQMGVNNSINYQQQQDLGLISGMTGMQIKSPVPMHGHFPPAPTNINVNMNSTNSLNKKNGSHDNDYDSDSGYSSYSGSSRSSESRSESETERTDRTNTGGMYDSNLSMQSQQSMEQSMGSQSSIQSKFIEEGAPGGDNFIVVDDENNYNYSQSHLPSQLDNSIQSTDSANSLDLGENVNSSQDISPYDRLRKKQQAKGKKMKKGKINSRNNSVNTSQISNISNAGTASNEEMLSGMGMQTLNHEKKKKKKFSSRISLPKLRK